MVAPVANMATWLQEANTAITTTSVIIKVAPALVEEVAAVRGMVTVESAVGHRFTTAQLREIKIIHILMVNSRTQ